MVSDHSKRVDQFLRNLRKVFKDGPRPDLFIRGTCFCDECIEHNQTLAAHSPDTIPLAEVGNPSWDPMCFASDLAFSYYMPGLIRLAFETEYYVDQLLFHLPVRLDSMSTEKLRAILETLWMLKEIKGNDNRNNFDEDRMEGLIHAIRIRLGQE